MPQCPIPCMNASFANSIHVNPNPLWINQMRLHVFLNSSFESNSSCCLPESMPSASSDAAAPDNGLPSPASDRLAAPSAAASIQYPGMNPPRESAVNRWSPTLQNVHCFSSQCVWMWLADKNMVGDGGLSLCVVFLLLSSELSCTGQGCSIRGWIVRLNWFNWTDSLGDSQIILSWALHKTSLPNKPGVFQLV